MTAAITDTHGGINISQPKMNPYYDIEKVC